jgi:ribonuclease VapC
MIVVDSSALIAILEQEPEAERFVSILRDAPRLLASAVTVYETGIVIGARRGREGVADLKLLLEELAVEVVPFAEPHISRALDAYLRYGKGIDPKARLNLGDCAAYALPRA